MKIGIGQINVVVGDINGNKEVILGAYKKLCQQGAELVVYPELTVVGYSPRDLLYKDHFISDNERALNEIAGEIGEVPALVGYVECDWEDATTPRYNSVAWCEGGEVKHVVRKTLLPSYGVFEEKHYFRPGNGPLVVDWRGKRIGLTVCEDIWTGEDRKSYRLDNADPVKMLSNASLDLVINCSASPWHYKKWGKREAAVKRVTELCKCPAVYVNFFGGNDELIFDGRSCSFNREGEIITRCGAFEEDLCVVDIAKIHNIKGEMEEIEEIYKGLVLGLRDYAGKVGFKKAILGLSGGIDSAVVAAIAVDALGAENVKGYGLPSAISSEHSKEDARLLAETLGIAIEFLDIQPIVDAAEEALEPVFKDTERGVAEENLQARARGMLLMGISNKTGALLLTTGNKTEMAVGYCTLYGDMAGGLAVISDVVKMKVYELARYINRKDEKIPKNTIEKEPSAELRPNQKDSDTLPDYGIMDHIVCLYIEEHLSKQEIIEMGFDAETVSDTIRRIDLNEYKRKQAPPGLKITSTAFGIGRRMPIVQRYKHR